MKGIYLFISIILLTSYTSFADSPLTSTPIYQAYSSTSIVKEAIDAKGRINEKLMSYLDESNPIDIKMAVINALGWKFKGNRNAIKFIKYLNKKYGFKSLTELKSSASAQTLICIAYLKAMDNYFVVTVAKDFANEALIKDPSSYTINIIHGLLESQSYLLTYNLSNYPKVYQSVYSVKENKNLIYDFNKAAEEIVFSYIDIYKKYL
jgi:hypothetical protein